VLEEIAAANKAIDVMLQSVKHGKDLSACADSCANYFNNKSILARRSNKKGRGSALQNFMELEKLREKEAELRTTMKLAGRPGLWEDFLEFQKQCKRERIRQEKQRKQAENATMAQVMRWFKYMMGATASLFSMLMAVMEFLNAAKGE
tara:strand:+ start:7608 stop:8051 length:444 start_codon:yes stop_codon:yes gene_type:complete